MESFTFTNAELPASQGTLIVEAQDMPEAITLMQRIRRDDWACWTPTVAGVWSGYGTLGKLVTDMRALLG
jgi:hypothetical protein